MLSNYLKIAWRNPLSDKGYSIIDTSGLTVGLGMAMLIGLPAFDPAHRFVPKHSGAADESSEKFANRVNRYNHAVKLPYRRPA